MPPQLPNSPMPYQSPNLIAVMLGMKTITIHIAHKFSKTELGCVSNYSPASNHLSANQLRQLSSKGYELGREESFSLAVDEALGHVSHHTYMGSPRPSLDLNIEGIKSWALKRFPHQIYYRVFDDRVELCRVLHPKRDITHE